MCAVAVLPAVEIGTIAVPWSVLTPWYLYREVVEDQGTKRSLCSEGMKVIRHAGVDSRMIILDNQARQ